MISTKEPEKLKIKTCLNHKATNYEPSECVVEKIITLPTEDFQHLLNEPLDDYNFIKENRMMMYSDANEVSHCLLAYDEESGDGLLINAEGYDYARYSAYISNAREMIQHLEQEHSGLQTVQAPITDSEKRLLNTISNIADRIATFAHLGSKDFSLEDTMRDLGYDFDDIKEMLLHAVAQKISAMNGIHSVEVNNLCVPLQLEITVTTVEETEDMTAKNEEIGGLSL